MTIIRIEHADLRGDMKPKVVAKAVKAAKGASVILDYMGYYVTLHYDAGSECSVRLSTQDESASSVCLYPAEALHLAKVLKRLANPQVN